MESWGACSPPRRLASEVCRVRRDVARIHRQPPELSLRGSPWGTAISRICPWAVSTSNKQHFWRLGRFNHQKSACLPLGPFQPSRNSIVGPWDRFNHPKTAFGALGAFQLPKTAHLRTASLKGIRPAFRLHSVTKLTFPNTAK